MFGFLKKLFGGDAETNKEAGVQIEQVPYKMEPPVVETKVEAVNRQPVKCGCGRSESGFCVGLHKLSEEEWAVHDANPKKIEPKPAAITAAKKPAAKKAATKKPAAKKPAARKKAAK
jgi:CDGSH-type Zn-finger protein